MGRSDVFVVIKHYDQGNQLREEFVLIPFLDGWSPQQQGRGSRWAWVLRADLELQT